MMTYLSKLPYFFACCGLHPGLGRDPLSGEDILRHVEDLRAMARAWRDGEADLSRVIDKVRGSLPSHVQHSCLEGVGNRNRCGSLVA